MKKLLEPEGTDAGPSRTAIILTALVWPGLGQFIQSRWRAGALYALGFLAALTVFAIDAFKILAVYYHVWADFNSFEVTALPLRNMLIAFGFGLIVYIAAVMDCVVAYMRQRTAWKQKQHRYPGMPGSTE